MNNLGGYKNIELVFIDEIETCIPTSIGMYLTKKIVNAPKRVLPLLLNSSLLSESKPNDAGTNYLHKASLLLSSSLSEDFKREMQMVDVRGCILIASYYNGNKKVFGCEEFPLYGVFNEISGSKPTDLHHYQLTLNATCTLPALTLVE